jgi:hypothetical protein
MDLFVTFNNRQFTGGEINNESNIESVGVYANGLSPESVAIAMMAVIDNLVIEPRDIVQWIVKLLPYDEQEKIATDILGQWGEDIVSSVGDTSGEREDDEAM